MSRVKYSSHKPIQKNSFKAKKQDDFAWAKDMINWVIAQSSFFNVGE